MKSDLISVRDQEQGSVISIRGGGKTFACNSRCYHAKGSDCTCVCGGLNHGVGFRQALANTKHMAMSMARNYARHQGLEVFRLKLAEGIEGDGLVDLRSAPADPDQPLPPRLDTAFDLTGIEDGYFVEDEEGRVINARLMGYQEVC